MNNENIKNKDYDLLQLIKNQIKISKELYKNLFLDGFLMALTSLTIKDMYFLIILITLLVIKMANEINLYIQEKRYNKKTIYAIRRKINEQRKYEKNY